MTCKLEEVATRLLYPQNKYQKLLKPVGELEEVVDLELRQHSPMWVSYPEVLGVIPPSRLLRHDCLKRPLAAILEKKANFAHQAYQARRRPVHERIALLRESLKLARALDASCQCERPDNISHSALPNKAENDNVEGQEL